MKAITVKSLKTQIPQQTKMMFWFLFASTKGAATRIRIANLLREKPYNANQISRALSLDYKSVKHHLNTLEKNNLIGKFETYYGGTYYLSSLFEENFAIFDEISSKINF